MGLNVLVGTKKGLFVLEGDAERREWTLNGPHLTGFSVYHAIRDPRDGSLYAATNFFDGGTVHRSSDNGETWERAEELGLPEGGELKLNATWHVEPGGNGELWLGGDPGVLFRSDDKGATWQPNEGILHHETREQWAPGAGGMCLHSIATWPGDPSRLALAISAVGVWLSDDGGQTWRHGNKGLVPRYIPEEAREETIALCVHNMHRAPSQPERIFMQFHGGVYRSDDAGESWIDIGADTGLPSDFGFPLVIDPGDPDSAYVIPLVADLDRVTPDGRVRVYETRDAGASWTARGDGLPAEDAYLTILRQAFGREGSGERMGLYFGATSGDVFGSNDAGATWFTAASKLPPVHSVRVA